MPTLQHPRSCHFLETVSLSSVSQVCRVTPWTSYPCSTKSAAATELSTPPDIPSTTLFIFLLYSSPYCEIMTLLCSAGLFRLSLDDFSPRSPCASHVPLRRTPSSTSRRGVVMVPMRAAVETSFTFSLPVTLPLILPALMIVPALTSP